MTRNRDGKKPPTTHNYLKLLESRRQETEFRMIDFITFYSGS